MDIIFHEKQQGSLCAQHCLNALLQGPYFTAVDLATIGHQMDDEERQRMSEAGTTEEYNRFLQEPSSNVDDSGYFSVQVLSAALTVWGLELVPFNSSDSRAVAARLQPTLERAFICHYRDHWFAVRRLGRQWFNLNSILPGPDLLSDTYLSLFLAQLQTDKYSIFVVVGPLPDCEADRVIAQSPVSPTQVRRMRRSAAASAAASTPAGSTVQVEDDDDDDQLKAVLEMSRKELEEEDDQTALNAAIMQSLQQSSSLSSSLIGGGSSGTANVATVEFDSAESDLARAISLSLSQQQQETSSTPSSSAAIEDSVEFIRQRRLERLAQLSSSSSSSLATDPTTTKEVVNKTV